MGRGGKTKRGGGYEAKLCGIDDFAGEVAESLQFIGKIVGNSEAGASKLCLTLLPELCQLLGVVSCIFIMQVWDALNGRLHLALT